MRSSTTLTTSKSPMLTPPLVTTASQDAAASSIGRGEGGLVVADEAEVDRASAPACATRASSIGRLHSRIWPGRERPTALDQLVAGREDADPGRGGPPPARTPMLASTPRWAGRSTVPAVRTTSPARTSSPVRRTASPGATGTAEAHPVAVEHLAVLDHDHGVGAVGHRRAGHDPQGLARADRDLGRGAGGQQADDLELDRDGRRCRPPARRSRRPRCCRTAAPSPAR